MAQIIEAKSTFMSLFSRSVYGITLGLITGASNIMYDSIDTSRDLPRNHPRWEEDQMTNNKKSSSKKRKSPVGFWDILTPWRISVDVDKMHITVKKRNWYFISCEESTHSFKSVRNIVVKNHVFGADIGIRVFAGSAEAYSISKAKAKQIKELLLNTDWAKNDNDIAVDIHN